MPSPQPRPGDFGVIATHDIGGWLIRLGTRSSVNHACIYLGGGRIAEATPPAVHIRGLGKGEVDQWQWSSVTLADTQRQAITDYAQAHDGERYGWLDILAVTLSVLGVRFPWVLNRIARPDTTDCSHFVSDAYLAAGIDLIPGKPSHLETPGDLLDVVDGRTAPEWW